MAITFKTLKGGIRLLGRRERELQTERQIAEYIMQTFLNGNQADARTMFLALNSENKGLFITFLRGTFQAEEVLNFIQSAYVFDNRYM